MLVRAATPVAWASGVLPVLPALRSVLLVESAVSLLTGRDGQRPRHAASRRFRTGPAASALAQSGVEEQPPTYQTG